MANPLTNRDRASWAHKALKKHVETTGSQDEDFVTQFGDLLSDLMHLARFEGLDFQYEVDRARGHFEAEVVEEPDTSRKEWDPRG